MRGSSIAAVLADARASTNTRPSLRNPSRPFTPADSGRHLFVGHDYTGSSRPSSSYGGTADAFLSGHPVLTSQGSSRSGMLRRTASGRALGRPPMPRMSLDLGATTGAVDPVGSGFPAPLPSPLSGPRTPKARNPDDKTFTSPNKQRRHRSASASASGTTKAGGEDGGSGGKEREGVDAVPVDEGVPDAAASLDGAALTASVLLQKLGEDQSPDTQRDLAKECHHCASELAAALAAAKRVKPVSKPGKEVMSRSVTAALTARRRLLRVCLRRMDKASVGMLLLLARAALTLTSIPGPLSPSSRPQSTGSASALQGAVMHICRLLFSASQDTSNDDAFRENGILQAILGSVRVVHTGGRGESKRAATTTTTTTDDESKAAGTTDVGAQAYVDFACRSPEDLIYSMGVLKNTSKLPKNQQWLVQQGAVPILIAVVRGCVRTSAVNARPSVQDVKRATPRTSNRELAQLLVQVTGCLRNLCLTKRQLKPFWMCDAVPALLSLLEPFKLHSELMLNICRIMSKLSLHAACRKFFTQSEEITQRFAKLLSLHSRQTMLLVRALFVLGNITSSNNGNRERLAVACNIVPTLLQLLDHFGSQYTRLVDAESAAGAGDGGEDGMAEGGGEGKFDSGEGKAGEVGVPPSVAATQRREVEELLVKLVRVIANIGINPVVGSRLAVTPGIDRLVDCLEQADMRLGEELVLNLVSAITNISFYAAGAPDADSVTPFSASVELSSFQPTNILHMHRLRITRLLAPLLVHHNEEAIVESARAFGNFSRNQEVRSLMISLRAVDALVILLDHTNRELVFTSCGVLMNIVSDEEGKQVLRRGDLDGVGKLVSLLHRCWEEDAEVAGLAAKTLFNFLLKWKGDDPTQNRPRFTAEQCVDLLEVLEDLTQASADAGVDVDAVLASDPNHPLSVVNLLRDGVRELVQTGAVAAAPAPPPPTDTVIAHRRRSDLEPLEGDVEDDI